MREVQREIVSALIFSKDGKLFQGMKSPNDGGVYANCWHIPGGGLDEGEDRIAGLIREVLKDTGEKVLCKMHFNVYKVTLDTDADDVSVVLSDDLVEYQWTSPANLKDLKLTPPSVELFTRLGYLA